MPLYFSTLANQQRHTAKRTRVADERANEMAAVGKPQQECRAIVGSIGYRDLSLGRWKVVTVLEEIYVRRKVKRLAL